MKYLRVQYGVSTEVNQTCYIISYTEEVHQQISLRRCLHKKSEEATENLLIGDVSDVVMLTPLSLNRDKHSE